MVDLQEMLEVARGHLDAGRLDSAEDVCRQALEVDPGAVEAARLLGLVALARGDADRAVEVLGAASSAAPDTPSVLHALGLAHRGRGGLEEAEVCLRRAGALAPDDPDVLNDLADLALTRGELDRAEELLRRALDRRPEHPRVLYNLGNLHVERGELPEAVGRYREAEAQAPGDWAIKSNMGIALKLLGALEQAEACLRRALLLDPGNPTVSLNLATVLLARGGAVEAERLCREVAVLTPDLPEPHNDLGLALLAQGRLDEAARAFLHALTIDQQDPRLHTNLGDALRAAGQVDRAVECYDRALGAAPTHARARHQRATALLLLGELRDGWRHLGPSRRRPEEGAGPPRWAGENGDGKSLLLHPDGDLRETLLLLRFVPHARRRFGEVALRCAGAVKRLLAASEPLRDVTCTPDEEPPAPDLHAALDDLPALLGLDRSALPGAVLEADPALVARWAERLDGAKEPRVGLLWRGEWGGQPLPLEELCGAAGAAGAALFSLQHGAGEPEQRALRRAGVVDLGADIEGMADALACLKCLDLLICPDCAAAHLAAASGQDALVLLERAPWWGWGLEGGSPWYPDARLARQVTPGSWDEPLGEVAGALSAGP